MVERVDEFVALAVRASPVTSFRPVDALSILAAKFPDHVPSLGTCDAVRTRRTLNLPGCDIKDPRCQEATWVSTRCHESTPAELRRGDASITRSETFA